MAETLREYLVKLGWSADKKSYKDSLKVLNDFTNDTGVKTKTIKSSYVTMALEITKSLLSLTNSIVEITKKTAYSDLAVERFAQKMWTSEKSARAFTTALSSLGQTYDDIFYMTSEEFSNFRELRDLGLSLEAPQELQNSLHKVREIYQEANKLKVIFEYLNQWTQWSFLEKNKTQLAEIKKEFQEINRLIIDNIPNIADKISSVMTIIFRLGSTIIWVGKGLIEFIYNLTSKLPKEAKVGLMAVGTFIAIYLTGPIGIAAAAILGILLILEDFKTYTEGGNAALSDLYDWIFKTKGILSEKIDDSFLGEVIEDSNKVVKNLSKILDFSKEWSLYSIFKNFKGALDNSDAQGFFGKLKDIFGFNSNDVASITSSTTNSSNKYDNRKNVVVNQKNEITLNDSSATAPYLIAQLQNINSTQLG